MKEIDMTDALHAEIKNLKRKIKQMEKKHAEISVSICRYRSREGHTFVCDYEGTEVVRCNMVGREDKCPAIQLFLEHQV